VNRKVICAGCHKDFSYEYKRGAPRKYCPDCKSWKKKTYNAYETECFYGVPLPAHWRLTKNGSGNITRWLRGKWVVLYDHQGVFGLSVNSRGWGKGVFRHSDVVAESQNVPQGITWAEGVVGALVRSYSAR
jgi:hypothetical protein